MNPAEYIQEVYTKRGSVKELDKADEGWVSIYLNKILIHDPKNAQIMSKIIDYHLYMKPQEYFYLLCLAIPKDLCYNKFYPKKKVKDEEEDILITKIREVLGWSQREYQLQKNIIERVVLNERNYWISQFGITEK